MRYALIGCGRIATNHIKAAIENKMEIAAVCDIIPDNMERLLEKHGINNQSSIARYIDYCELLEEEKPTLVAVATESGKHAEIALACIDAGCNVIIEKPIALSLSDADEIIHRAEEKGVKVCACHQNRFNVPIQHIRKAMDEGRFGKLSHGTVHVRWNRNQDYYTQAPWRGTWAQDGGALMNQSIHGIDMLRWLMGDEIEEVFAYTANQYHPFIECEDVGLAVVKFKSGAFGTIEGTTNVYPKNLEETLYIFGQNGTVKAGGKSMNTIDSWQFADSKPEDANLMNGIEESTANIYGNGHTSVYADVKEAIEKDRPVYIDAYAGRRALELVLAIYKSSAEGVLVRLPLTQCTTMDLV